MCDSRRSNRDSVEFLQKVLRIVEWVNEENMEEWNGNRGKLIGKRLQKELSLARAKVEQVGNELRAVNGEKEELVMSLLEKEKEIDKLRAELEREKWEACDAKVNMNEMAKEVAKLYWRIGELVERIRRKEVDDGDVQIIEDESGHWESPAKKKKRDENGRMDATEETFRLIQRQVEEQMKKWEKDREGTKKELERTNQFVENIKKLVQENNEKAKMDVSKNTPSVEVQVEMSPSARTYREPVIKALKVVTETEVDIPLNLSQSPVPIIAMEAENLSNDQKQQEATSTLTLTFHRSSPSPPPSTEYPPQQLEFFHTLLGLPTQQHIIPETITTTTPPPKASPLVPEFVNSPTKVPTTAATSNPTTPFPSPPSHSLIASQAIQNRVEEEETKEIYHATDPFKRHLGYFCTCGLECSTKKTLQYHLQYLQSNNNNNNNDASFNSPSSITNTEHEPSPYLQLESTAQSNVLPSSYPPVQYPPKSIRVKNCKRCGQSYTGGKEGLRQHNIMAHHQHHQEEHSHNLSHGTIPIPIPHPQHHFTCTHCPEIFRTMVQLRLHHKVKHSSSSITMNPLSF